MNIEYDNKNEINIPIEEDLRKNIRVLEAMFSHWGDIVKKRFCLEREQGMVSIYIIYIDGLTDNEMVERTITRPLLYEWRGADDKAKSVFEHIYHNQTEAVDLTEKYTMMDVIDGVLKGDTAIFVDGAKKAMLLSTKKLPTRSIDSPQKEAGLKGPRDSFNENFRVNTALIRRRIKDPKMKLKEGDVWWRSKRV